MSEEVLTAKERQAQMAAQARAYEAELLARWRAAHPEATCSDRIALILATRFGLGA